jgi:phosphate-selective porin OprO/OprP
MIAGGVMSNFKQAGGIGLGAILLAGVASAAMAQPVDSGFPPAAQAPATAVDPREARIDQLETEVQELAGEVADLKRSQAAQIDTIASVQNQIPPKPSAAVSITNGVPTIASTDGRFTAKFHGILQLDAADYDQRAPGKTTGASADLRRDGGAVGATSSDFAHARDLKDGTDFRRARIGVDGVMFGDLDYRLIFDFAGTGVEDSGQLYEGWIQYSGFKPLHIRVGAFAQSIGLDDQDSTNGMPFLERSGSADLARGVAAGDTRIGAQLFGYGKRWFASAAVTGRTIGVVNTGTVPGASGAVGTAQTFGDQLGFVGRVAGTPLRGSDWLVHLGVHGSYVDSPANTTGPAANGLTPATAETIDFKVTPELRVDGTSLIDTGKLPAKSAATGGLEFAAQKKNFFLQSEYEYFEVNRSDIHSNPNFSGFYVEGTWLITGESRTYNNATAAFDGPSTIFHPFDPKNGGWGAWELGVRYSDLDLNYNAGAVITATGSTKGDPLPADIRGGDQRIVTVGLNWYLNPAIRFMFDYQYVTINRLSPGLTASNASSVWTTPLNAQIGQNYSAFSVRSQLAF